MRKRTIDLAALKAAGSSPSQEPAVASLTAGFRAKNENGKGSADDVRQKARELLSETAAAVSAGGGFIGHIKACASFASGGSLGFSVVKEQVRVTEDQFNGEEAAGAFKLAVTAIVYGFPKEDLTNLLERGLAGRFPESLFARQYDLKLAPIKAFSGAAANSKQSVA